MANIDTTQMKYDPPEQARIEASFIDNDKQVNIESNYKYDPVEQARIEASFIDSDEESPSFSMDDLDTKQDWIQQSKAIYKHENQKDFEGTDKEAAEWFKDRHSALNNNLTNLGMTALSAKDMPDEVKNAWLKSLETYENTDSDLFTFGRAIKNTFKDPLTYATATAGVGVGGVAKILGTRGAAKLGIDKLKRYLTRFNFKEQVNQELTKKVGKKATEEFIKKGASPTVTKEVLKGARKKAAKDIGSLQLKTGAAAGAGWGGGFNIAEQALRVEVDPEKDEIDAGEAALATILGAGLMGAAGKYLPKATEKIARNRAIRKAEATEASKQAGKRTDDFIDDAIDRDDNDNSFRQIVTSRAQLAADALNLNGNIKLNIGRTLTKPQIKNIKEIYSNKGMELDTYDDGKTFVGKRLRDVGDDPNLDASIPPDRKLGEEKLAKFKSLVYDDSGLGNAFKRVRQQFDRVTAQTEKNIQRRFQRLTKAIQKDYGVKDINDIGPDELKNLNRYLEGDQGVLQSLQARGFNNVIKEIDGMRENIKVLQEKLLEKGVIKDNEEGQLLRAKIETSMDKKGELYLTRQYEIFDNPNWKSELAKSPEGTEIIKNAKQFLRDDYKARVGEDYYRNNRQRIENAVDEDLLNLLTVNNEEDILQVFQSVNTRFKNPSKILTKRGTVPEQLRLLLGEYKDPFTNYANTIGKVFQTIETHNYEKKIAKLIKYEKIKGVRKGSPLGTKSVPLRSTLIRNVEDKNIEQQVRDLKKLIDNENLSDQEISDRFKQMAEKEPAISRPLDEGDFYAYKEVADTIAQGNEVRPIATRWIGELVRLQSYTRAAKTVYSPAATARNFLGSAMMALGAGYISPKKIAGIKQVAKGLSKLSDDDLRAEMEKGIRLGYIQSGVDLNSFRGALNDAGDVKFWKLESPLYKGGKKLKNQALKYNTSVIKLYQSMDDMWKQVGFLNERDMQRQVILDKGRDPDEIVDSFLSADGKTVNITRLDVTAANKVADHMQNYANVPQFIKYARRLPFADFLAFQTELARTTKNIITGAFRDIKEGRQLMQKGEKAFDSDGVETNLLKGQRQFLNGLKRLGSVSVAISSVPVISKTSSWMAGLDERAIDPTTEEPLPYTVREGIEGIANADWETGSNFIYFGDPKNPKNPLRGRRLNLSYLNPWATGTDAMTAAFRAFDRGEDVDGAVSDAVGEALIKPIAGILGPSMAADIVVKTLYQKVDEFGKPLYDDNDPMQKKVGAILTQTGKAIEPGISKAIRDISMSLENPASVKAETYGTAEPDMFGLTEALLPEQRKRSGVRSGKTGRRYYAQDQITGLFGIKPQTYNLKTELALKLRLFKKELGDSNKPFKNVYQDRSIRTPQEYVDAYRESLDRSYNTSTKVYDLITKAKSAGFTNTEIYKAMTDGGLFSKRYDKNIFRNVADKGIFIPKEPNYEDMFKWAKSTKKMTGVEAPINDIYQQLMQVYNSYLGKKTGDREVDIKSDFKYDPAEQARIEKSFID